MTRENKSTQKFLSLRYYEMEDVVKNLHKQMIHVDR